MAIQLIESDAIDRLLTDCPGRSAFFSSLLKSGVKPYISNVETNYSLLRLDDLLIPLTINETEYDNSYVASNYYAVQQMRRKRGAWWSPLSSACGVILRQAKVNRVVIVNNWLLSNTLYPKLSRDQVNAITHFLARRFPDSLIMWRSLGGEDCVELIDHLQCSGYLRFFSRHIYRYIPQEKLLKKAAYHRRRDLRLFEKEGYSLEKEGDFDKLLNLYQQVYLQKHTPFAPAYTKRFLEEATAVGFLQLRVLKKEGKSVGVFGFVIDQGVMIVPFFGYEMSGQEHLEYYRLLTTLTMLEAEKHGVILNDGSGGETTKSFRGMQPDPEYAAIYVDHLPLMRRSFWRLAEKGAKIFSPSQSRSDRQSSDHRETAAPQASGLAQKRAPSS